MEFEATSLGFVLLSDLRGSDLWEYFARVMVLSDIRRCLNVNDKFFQADILCECNTLSVCVSKNSTSFTFLWRPF